MELTPNDIRNYDFPGALRGYAKDNVDQFVEQVATALESAKQENLRLSMEIESLTSQLAGLKQFEETIKNAAIDARRNADLTVDRAKQEAELILSKAKNDAQKVVESKALQITEIEEKINQLDVVRKSYMAKLKSLISSHLELVAEVVAEETPRTTESGKIQITDSKEVSGEVRETVAAAPSAVDGGTSDDTDVADGVAAPQLDEQASPEQGKMDADLETGEEPGESIDPELAAALENYKSTGAIPVGELVSELQQPETLVGGPSIPKPGEIIETTRRAEDIPDGFVAAPEDQPEGTGQITDRIAQAEQNKASEDNDNIDPDAPVDGREPVTPDELTSSLDDVVSKLDELDKAEKS